MKIERASVLVLGLLCFGLVQAQAVPDAGSLRQQIERERELQLPRKLAPQKPSEPPAMQPLSGVSVTVTAFRFAGNTLLSAAQLAPVVSDYLNRPLDYSQLQAAATAVANAYREAGWNVRAYLPRQDVTDGVVSIQIVEAVFSGAVFEGAEPRRMGLAGLVSRIEAVQAKGQLLNTNHLDRALLLASDLPGVDVTGFLRPGADPDSTELVLRVIDKPVASGEVSIDNTGSRSTGQQRSNTSLAFNSPAGLGDLLNANFLASQGSEYARFAYSVPLGLQGIRIGASVSAMRYHVVTPEFALLASHGTSQTSGLELSYPLVRSRLRNLYLNFNYDSKRYHNEASLSVQSDYQVDVGSFGLSGNLYDSLGGGGANSANLTWSTGVLDHHTLESGELPALDGHFFKLRYSAARQQVISETLSVHASYAGQRAQRDLDSSEKFFLGGAGGVRAYPASEAGGSSGQLANLELRLRLPENFTISGFRDWGRVSNFDSAPSYSVSGVGLALAWYNSFGANLKLTLARRSGNNPNPVASSGRDQDGSLIFNRCWLTFGIPF